jgi:hypothetical protein
MPQSHQLESRMTTPRSKSINTILSMVEELEAVVTANLQRATRLRQSIPQKAFTGELA